MNQSAHLHDLIQGHKAIWIDRLHGWLACPDDIVGSFSREGFQQYRCELIRGRCEHCPLGGLWEGLDESTGSVVSVIWVNRPGPREAIVYVDVDGLPLEGTMGTATEEWWTELDGEVLRCLSAGALEPAEIGRRLGISGDAATSLVALLAREGKVRICLVAAETDDVVVVRSFWCPFRDRQVTAEFRESPGSWSVSWCSAFTPPTSLGCATRCLELDGLPDIVTNDSLAGVVPATAAP
jgi:hypothetical protein